MHTSQHFFRLSVYQFTTRHLHYGMLPLLQFHQSVLCATTSWILTFSLRLCLESGTRVGRHECRGVNRKVRGQRRGSVLSFHYAGPRDGTQVIRTGSKGLHLPSHLDDCKMDFYTSCIIHLILLLKKTMPSSSSRSGFFPPFDLLSSEGCSESFASFGSHLLVFPPPSCEHTPFSFPILFSGFLPLASPLQGSPSIYV